MKKSITITKNSFNPLMIASLLLLTMSYLIPTALLAQRVVDVPSFTVLNTFIHGDTTATGERVDNNTIYQLERDGIYEVTSPISLNARLHLRGAEGEGALPAIFPKQAEGGGWPQVINTRGDLFLEYVYISNQNGAVNRWLGIGASGANSRVEVRGSHIEWSKTAAVALLADSITFIMEDSRVSKQGNRNIYQGNGRLVDIRTAYADTIIIRNTTF